MTPILKFSLALAMGAFALILASCTNLVTSPFNNGNLADPAYLEANEVMSQSTQNSQDALLEGIDQAWTYFFGSTPFTASVNDTVIHVYENGWHHLTISYANGVTGSTYHLEDSVQFLDTLGTPQQNPDTTNLSLVDFRVRRYLHIAEYDTSEVFRFRGEDTVVAGMTLEFNTDASVTINAAAGQHAVGTFLHHDSSGVECTLDVTLAHALNDVVVPRGADQCITTGQFVASGSLNIVCPFASGIMTVSGTWSRTVNIGENYVTFIAQHGTTHWIVVVPKPEFCSQATIARVSGVLAGIQD